MVGPVAIEFKCQGCQKTLRVPDKFAGRKAKCPKCQTILQVPAGEEAVETVEPLSVQPPIASSSNPFAALDNSGPSQSSRGQGSIPNRSPVNPYNTPHPQSPGRQRSSGEPHRGGIILGLGIASVVLCNFCFIPGAVALILGFIDLGAMKNGRMDNEGYGLTLAGVILGGIMTVISALGFFLYLLIFIGAALGA